MRADCALRPPAGRVFAQRKNALPSERSVAARRRFSDTGRSSVRVRPVVLRARARPKFYRSAWFSTRARIQERTKGDINTIIEPGMGGMRDMQRGTEGRKEGKRAVKEQRKSVGGRGVGCRSADGIGSAKDQGGKEGRRDRVSPRRIRWRKGRREGGRDGRHSMAVPLCGVKHSMWRRRKGAALAPENRSRSQ